MPKYKNGIVTIAGLILCISTKFRSGQTSLAWLVGLGEGLPIKKIDWPRPVLSNLRRHFLAGGLWWEV